MKLFSLVILLMIKSVILAQSGYTVNDITRDFAVNKILNYSPASSTFKDLKVRLVIVDFFATWCMPCVRALPKLTALQQQYKDEIRVLLVSEESQVKLESFIKKQNNFTLPVVVDEEGVFIKLFQPPSYPYTVIVGKNGKIISIPSLEEVNEVNINKWLSEQNTSIIVGEKTNKIDSVLVTSNVIKETFRVEKSSNKLVQLSQEFMYAAKTGDEAVQFITQFKNMSFDDLKTSIKTDDEKTAFWINLYNAYTQVSLKKNPEQYKKRSQFFGSKQIEIAGKEFSLDDIEHGILRRSSIKWSLGYLKKLFPGKTEKQLRVSALDYRIHFALNCGAKSCPPIAFYKPETINQQLDLATNAYLKGEAVYDKATNTVKLPTLMNWFRRDFGGKRKMIDLLKKLSIIPIDKNPKIKFKDYDWTLYLQNYKS